MTCCYPQTANQQFCEKAALQDLERYRKKGPDSTTRRLLEAVRATGLDSHSILDLGAGIGVILLELLPGEARRGIHVEAASGYQRVAEKEVQALGKADSVRFVQGDFVELEPELPECEVVTLDRVICCYPELESLVAGSARKATRLWAASYPRDRWWPRLGVVLENLFRKLSGNEFRTYVHSTERLEEILTGLGFWPSYKNTGFIWETVAWERCQAAPTG